MAAAERLTARDPLRGTGWALLLRVLYLAGRLPETLRRYEEVRRLLAGAPGLDPGPRLRALHDGVLRHDLHGFLTALGVPDRFVPEGTAARTALFRGRRRPSPPGRRRPPARGTHRCGDAHARGSGVRAG